MCNRAKEIFKTDEKNQAIGASRFLFIFRLWL